MNGVVEFEVARDKLRDGKPSLRERWRRAEPKLPSSSSIGGVVSESAAEAETPPFPACKAPLIVLATEEEEDEGANAAVVSRAKDGNAYALLFEFAEPANCWLETSGEDETDGVR